MTFNLIGLGLNKNSISTDALENLQSCDKIYLENYTVDFPYKSEELEKSIGQKIISLDRSRVEDESILAKAKDQDIALLVYGDALSATTHTQLVLECKKQNIPCKVFHNASIMTAIAATGLQLYKFGKTASMPNWTEHTNKPTSFMNYIKENQSIKAHTLLLTDIGLEMRDAIDQLEDATKDSGFTNERAKLADKGTGVGGESTTNATARQLLPEKIIAISNAGTENQKIFYDTPKVLKDKKVDKPFCLIIPGEMHFIEEEALAKIII